MSTAVFVLLVSLGSLIALLAVNFFVAKEFYKAALMKGWPEKKYFWFPFLLPIAGYILVCALPDRGGRENMRAFISDDLPDI